MLDDQKLLKQRDSADDLGFALATASDTVWQPQLVRTDHDGREIKHVVVAGMGGSTLAADVLKDILKSSFHLPIEVVKGYDLPGFVNSDSLVIVSSQSGNTEETLACYDQAKQRGSQVAVLSTGGELLRRAEADDVLSALIPTGGQPRMAMIKHLRSLLAILEHFDLIDDSLNTQIASSHQLLTEAAKTWRKDSPVHANYAKQLALMAVGKTPVIFGGEYSGSLAYKWKISFNENAKNTAFCNQYPEYNHNEFIGWSSHPIEKPFAIFDLVSDLERPRIRERMELSDRLLSGRRPKSHPIYLQGDTLVAQILWGCILADATAIYVAVLNNVAPSAVDLIERFKRDLS